MFPVNDYTTIFLGGWEHSENIIKWFPSTEPAGAAQMPRTKEDNERIRMERRRAILRDSLPVIAEKGLSATKISDLAQAAKISVGLIYSYFPSKEDIFVELINEYLESGQKMVEEVKRKNLAPMDCISALFTDLFEASINDNDGGVYFRLYLQISFYPQLWDRLIISDFMEDPVYQLFCDMVRQGQNEGTFRKGSSDAMSLVLGYIALGMNMNSLNPGKLDLNSEDVIQLIRTMLLA